MDKGKDKTWKKRDRVSLVRCTDMDRLIKHEAQLQECKEQVLKNMKIEFFEAIRELGWSEAEEERFFSGSPLPYMSRKLCEYYCDLVSSLCRQQQDGWDAVKADVVYFTEKLLRIRDGSSTRFRCMIETYIFLRDQKAKNFESISRMKANLKDLQKKVRALQK